MPNDRKITEPPANLTELPEANKPKAELPREDIMLLPTGYQKIDLRPLVPKSIAETVLVCNKVFGFKEPAGGCGKPISKIVE